MMQVEGILFWWFLLTFIVGVLVGIGGFVAYAIITKPSKQP